MRNVLPVSLAVAALLVFAAGCGGSANPKSSKTPTPPESARQPVADFLAALRARRFADACMQIPASVQRNLRDAAVGSHHVQPGTEANRLRQVQAAHARAATCPGALSLLAEEMSSAQLDRIADRARTQPLHWIGPPGAGLVTIGDDEDWDITRHGGHWRIDTINALPPEA